MARLFSNELDIVALSGHSNADLLVRQAREVLPSQVVVTNRAVLPDVKDALASLPIEVLPGDEGLPAISTRGDVDVVVAAIVGRAGLESVLAAANAGKTIALANKEALVIGGEFVIDAIRKSGGTLLPVDSEHSAIYQCLAGENERAVSRLILTASGGPFRDRDLDSFGAITKQEALAHPNWEMGSKITVDSATMMNKGLEVIEARWLFDKGPDDIDVVIHPQSIIHSLVEFVDGSYKAQLGIPDMKVPIQYALSFPGRWAAPNPRVDWGSVGSLTFRSPDPKRYPCLDLAYSALRSGGAYPAVLNAANEIAVEMFLSGQLAFTGIAETVSAALDDHKPEPIESVDQLLAVDSSVRRTIMEQNNIPSH